MSDIPQNLHRDIMRGVKLVKTRYYLYGVFTGFLISLSILSFVVYEKMIEYGSVDFISVWFESIKINTAELLDFNDEILEFIPWFDLGVWFVVMLTVLIFMILFIRYRRILFLKIEKFSNIKNSNK
ncbi:MAG: hypothetical protein A2537_00490 [Candidatus Magasanikbacteria bacterium RIFOXYD2_FULL_36_9]|uniref:Uncharacterized protein n=1 Tax=Candidatus Magasanikbacteria bacterium RIFOXYD2_FULL_36_9 TaxID=1798707 RepID=A0A1F6NYZ4_9BACT|nr:MAG: hypothetical protein A2537_00490 [Candidatus Magasanikbacteria bacterium RIFOXYD2_FULL_36_9]